VKPLRVLCQNAAGQRRTVDVSATTDQGASNAALRQLNSWRVVRVMPRGDGSPLSESEIREGAPLATPDALSSGSLSARPKRRRGRGGKAHRARSQDGSRTPGTQTGAKMQGRDGATISGRGDAPARESAESPPAPALVDVPPRPTTDEEKAALPVLDLGRIVQKGDARDWIGNRDRGRHFDTNMGHALRAALERA